MASWSGYWALIVLIAVVLPIDYKYSPKAILMIGLLNLAFVVGGMPLKYKVVSLVELPNVNYSLNKSNFISAKIFVNFSLVCSIIICLIYFYAIGFSFDNILAQMTVIYMAPSEISYMRYYSDNPYSFWVNLFAIPVYSSALISGFIFPSTDRLRNKLIFLGIPLISTSLMTLVTTSKMNFLIMVFFFLAAYITSQIILHKKKKYMMSRHEIFLIILLCSLTVLIFFSSLLLRYKNELSNLNLITTHFVDSFSGFLTGFSAWFEQYLDGVNDDIDYWGFTFQWVGHFIDNGDRLQGLFLPILDYKGYGTPSNIFTIYRCIIEDFTLFGAIILLSLSAYLFSMAYVNLLGGSLKVVNWGGMLLYYPSLFYSFIFFVYGYSTVLAAWFLACFLIKLMFFYNNK